MKKTVLLSVAMVLTPFVAFAQNLGYFSTFVAQINGLITAAVPVVIGIAILLFMYGLMVYLLNQDNEDKRSAARNLMFWGVVIIFVMLALWGLVALLGTIVGVSTSGTPAGLGPQLPA